MSHLYIDQVIEEAAPQAVTSKAGTTYTIREWRVLGSVDGAVAAEHMVRTFSSKVECQAVAGWEGTVEADMRGGQPTGKWKIPTPRAPGGDGGFATQAPAQAQAQAPAPSGVTLVPQISRPDLEALCDYAQAKADWGEAMRAAFVTAAAGMGLRAPVSAEAPQTRPAPTSPTPSVVAGEADAALKEAGLLSRATTSLTNTQIAGAWNGVRGNKEAFTAAINGLLAAGGQLIEDENDLPF